MTRKTADQLLRELEANPQWRAERGRREAALAERARAAALDERELVAEIRAVGYDVESVYDLVNNAPHPVLERRFIGPYPAAYPILLRHLGLPHSYVIREGIVRALTVRDGGPAVATALLAAFVQESDAELRWVLANALRAAMPYRLRRRHPEIAAVLKGSQGQQLRRGRLT